jgi:putative transposase
MVDYLRISDSVGNMSVHLVWVTKYLYHVLQGDIQQRTRDLLIQICNNEMVQSLKGVVNKAWVFIDEITIK